MKGCGAKVLNCFAAGAFMLTDYRDDLRDELGDIADRFMYRDKDDLHLKIEHYMTHPEERAEIVSTMQSIIRSRLRLAHFFERACSEAIPTS